MGVQIDRVQQIYQAFSECAGTHQRGTLYGGEAVLRDGLRSVGEDGERGASHGEMTVDLAIVLHDGSCRNRGRTASAFRMEY